MDLLEITVPHEWVDYNGHMNDAEYARAFSMAATARSASTNPTVKVMSVWPSSDTFCTIMSTLTPASDNGPKMAAATPGLSATL